MHPIIVRIPLVNWDLSGYGLALMLGFLLSVVWAAQRAAKSKANPDVVLNCAFIALLAGVAGARFMHVVDYWDEFRYHRDWLSTVIAVIDIRQGGLEVYGGVIAAMLGAVIYLVGWRHSVRWYLDIIAPSLALGMGLGRVGCFLNGCCWGKPAEVPWAVRFPFGSNAMIDEWEKGIPGSDLPKELVSIPPGGIMVDGRPALPLPRELLWTKPSDLSRAQSYNALRSKLSQAKSDAERQQIGGEMTKLVGCQGATVGNNSSIVAAMETYGLSLAQLQTLARQHPSLPVHPTQVYSTISLVLLALLLNSLYWRRKRDGQVIFTMLLIEPWLRYTLELLRADNPLDSLGFTISQKLAIGLSSIGLLGLIALQFLPPRSPSAKPWEPPEEPPSRGKARPAHAQS